MFRFAQCLENKDKDATIAEVLLAHPEHRHAARRVQIAAKYPYAEIRDNTICADMLPIDMLRFKLSFFGAKHFDPRSDRWVRINMFAGAPYPQDLADAADDWFFPDFANMIPSLSEITATGRKAAKGAGYSWGHGG